MEEDKQGEKTAKHRRLKIQIHTNHKNQEKPKIAQSQPASNNIKLQTTAAAAVHSYEDQQQQHQNRFNTIKSKCTEPAAVLKKVKQYQTKSRVIAEQEEHVHQILATCGSIAKTNP